MAAFALLNVLAYSHAWSMLHFTTGGARTKVPEALGPVERARVLLFGVHIPKPVNDRTPHAIALDFTTVRFPTSDHLTLEGWWIPRAEPRGVVLLFHGYAGWKATLLNEARAFHDLGYSCLLVDLRGSGGSDGTTTSIGYREADDVAAAVAFTRRELDRNAPIILYGQSMGSVAIFRALAIDSLGVSAAITEAVFDRMINAIRNRFAIMGVPSFPSAELLCFWGGVQLGFPSFEHDPVEYAKRIHTPMLMLEGTDDPRATLEQARRVHAQLSGPKAFAEFPGARHEALLQAAPLRWHEAVGGFLAARGLVGPPQSEHPSHL